MVQGSICLWLKRHPYTFLQRPLTKAPFKTPITMAKPNKCIIMVRPRYRAISFPFLSARINCCCKTAEQEAGSGVGARDQSGFSAVVVVCLTGTMITSRRNKWRTSLEERCGLAVWSSLWAHWLFYFPSACWQSCAIDSFPQHSTEATDSTRTLKHNHSTSQQWMWTSQCDFYRFFLPLFVCFKLTFLQVV